MQGDRQKVNRRYKCDNGDSCWDEDPINCPVWAKAGACKDPNWVINTCPKLCCSDTSNPWGQLKICNQNANNKRSDCGYIGATLGCTNNTVVGGMNKFCRQSCGFCKRPSNYKLNPMVITNCEKTCNPQCTQNNGCNLSLPPNNPDFDKTKPVSQCKTLPAKSKLTTAKWCASSAWAREIAKRHVTFVKLVILCVLIKTQIVQKLQLKRAVTVFTIEVGLDSYSAAL